MIAMKIASKDSDTLFSKPKKVVIKGAILFLFLFIFTFNTGCTCASMGPLRISNNGTSQLNSTELEKTLKKSSRVKKFDPEYTEVCTVNRIIRQQYVMKN